MTNRNLQQLSRKVTGSAIVASMLLPIGFIVSPAISQTVQNLSIAPREYQISGQIPSNFSQVTNRATIQVQLRSGVAQFVSPNRDGSWSTVLKDPPSYRGTGGYEVRVIPPSTCNTCLVNPPARVSQSTHTTGLDFEILDDRMFYHLQGQVTDRHTNEGVGSVMLSFSPPIGNIDHVVTSDGRDGDIPKGSYYVLYRHGQGISRTRITPSGGPQNTTFSGSQDVSLGLQRVYKVLPFQAQTERQTDDDNDDDGMTPPGEGEGSTPPVVNPGTAPSISNHPQSTGVEVGEVADFFASAPHNIADGVARFTWFIQRVGQAPQALDLGENINILKYTATASDNGAQVWVEVANNVGKVESNRATLRVGKRPTLSQHPQNTGAEAGEVASFSSFAPHAIADGVARFTWVIQRVGQEAQVLDLGKNTNILEYTTTPEDDGAQVWVVVANDIGNVVSNPATLRVGERPTISQHPQDVTAKIGEVAEFSSFAPHDIADGTAFFTWFIQRVGQEPQALDLGKNTNLLQYTAMADDDGARVWVSVNNQIGSVISNKATIQIVD